MKQHIETESEWQLRQATDIIEYTADQLYVGFPFLYRALHPSWIYGNNEAGYAMATDGERLLLPATHVMELFRKNEAFLERSYLHMILHCLYGHLWTRGNRAVSLYNLACDVAVERAIDTMDKPQVRRILTWIRQSLYEEMSQREIVSPAQIYEYLLEKEPEYLDKIAIEFYVDDHHIWPKEEKKQALPNNQGQAEKKWQDIARQTKLGNDRSKENKDAAVDNFLAQAKTEKRKMTYKDFLKKFVRPREELRVNEDELDLGFYSFGLRYYNDANRRVPLIEPLETIEDQKIKDFVIAIDTSASTAGELVRRFVKETVHMLLEDNYTRDYHISILQCDDEVRRVEYVTSQTSIEEYFSNYELVGGGNTDFRPAFSYISERVKEGQIKKPEGLIYFTDGEGIYPKEAPDVKTAFVFLGKYNREKVPAWAIFFEPDVQNECL